MKETTLVIWGPLKVSNKYQKMLKLDYAFFESMAEKNVILKMDIILVIFIVPSSFEV